MEKLNGYDRMTEENKIADFEKRVVGNLNQYLDHNRISQARLASLCKDHGYNISQSTVSRLCSGQRRITVYYLHAICRALEIECDKLMNYTGSGAMRPEFLGGRHVQAQILSDPYVEEQGFEGYLGNYFIYLISTNAYEHGKVVKGQLSIEKKRDLPYCQVSVRIPAASEGRQNEAAFKYLQGQLVIMKHKSLASIILLDEAGEELSFLMMRHHIYGSNTLDCRVGAALTVTTSGNEKVPCMQKVLISKSALSQKGLDYIKPMFKLGKNSIVISETDYKEIINTLQIPYEQQEKIGRHLDKQSYLEISENILNEIRDKIFKEELGERFYTFQEKLSEKDILWIENDSVDSDQDKKLCAILNFLKQQEGAHESR